MIGDGVSANDARDQAAFPRVALARSGRNSCCGDLREQLPDGPPAVVD